MSFVRYNAEWSDDYKNYPLRLELDCIKRGGQWTTADGRTCGEGMFQHMMNARKLAWPKRYRHRWTDLLYQNFIENDITVLLGCASSQKTSHTVEYILLRYWSSPEDTLCVLSTVNMDKLDIGVYAELVALWDSGRKLHEWLPGHIVGYKRAITTDDIDESDVRLFTRGIICFPPETLVDTPSGQVAIKDIKEGDLVKNAIGVGRVRMCMNSISKSLVRVRMHDGRTIDCTPEHPFFTQKGWVKAIDLKCFDVVLSADETLQMLRGCFSSEIGAGVREQEVLPDMLSPHASENLRVLQKNLASLEGCNRKILQQSMFVQMGLSKQIGLYSEVSALRKEYTNEAIEHEILLRQLPPPSEVDSLPEVWKAFPFQSSWQESISILQSILLCEVEGNENFNRPEPSNSIGTENLGCVRSELHVEFSGENGDEKEQWKGALVQGGHCVSRNQVGGGGGWSDTQKNARIPTEGRESGRYFNGTWVDSVEVLESRGDERFSKSEGGYRVYNIEVEGHPSYSVNGALVHNCRPCYVGGRSVGLGILAGLKQENLIYFCDELQFMADSFAGSWPHLFSNGNVKIIGSGNPKHDPEDQLSIAAEPRDGWDSIPEPDKTTVWDTKFMGGRCVNLVGTDSPNFDVGPEEKDPYPKLIGRKFEARMAHDHGRDSFEYYRLVKGVMKIGFSMSRVITRQLCRDNNALEGVTWRDDNQTRLYALDPSYGGEDRCVGMPLKFGYDVDGKLILLFMPYKVFHINLQLKNDKGQLVEVEDQIASTLEEELTLYNVPPENCGYDACGKGTIGAALARRFGNRVPKAIDSGDKPSKRSVRNDLKVKDDATGMERLKRCDEHYSKFVTEMWFSWRYSIMAGQLRGLLPDVMAEGCARIYYVVSGNRIEVEPKNDPKAKEDLKRRLGKSPDLADVAAIGVEVARQLGFTIGSLSGESQTEKEKEEDFFEQEAREHAEFIKSHLLERS